MLGTGDLSELALGWCTYGVGDQMSHYNVNAGVPKTLIQHLIRWVISSRQFEGPVQRDARVDPRDRNLARAGAGRSRRASRRAPRPRSGPYELQDFNLFYTLRYGFKPSKIAFLALRAWGDRAKGTWPPGFPEAKRNVYTLS